MKEEFDRYLKEIGIKEFFYERSVGVFNLFSNLIDEDIKDIFVSEFVDGEGKRIYSDMLLFTRCKIIEARQFLRANDYFFNCLQNYPLSGFDVQTTEYDFKTATEKSRLTMRATFGAALEISAQASGRNCDYLGGILRKYFFPSTGSSYCTVKSL
jgi:hypothetical protein